MDRNRTDPRIARFAIPLALVAVLAAGCAQRTTTAVTGQPHRVSVDLSGRGKLVSAQVGQVITVSLGSPSKGGAWTVATYPRSMLSITSSDPERGKFTFQARGKGQGRVGFTLLGRCGPPLLEAMPEGTLCPDSGRTKSVKGVQPGAPVPASLITYTVRVG